MIFFNQSTSELYNYKLYTKVVKNVLNKKKLQLERLVLFKPNMHYPNHGNSLLQLTLLVWQSRLVKALAIKSGYPMEGNSRLHKTVL